MPSDDADRQEVDLIALLREDFARARNDIMKMAYTTQFDMQALRELVRADREERITRQAAVDFRDGQIAQRLAALEEDRIQRTELLYRMLARLEQIEQWVGRPWWRRLRGV